MKRRLLSFLAIVITFGLSAQNLEDLDFGTDPTLDIVTWNIEWFPKEGATTIEYVKEIIQAIEADVIAVQEVDQYNDFNEMIDELDGWDGFTVMSEYLNLAYIYNPEFVQVNSYYQILPGNDRELPRKPLVLEIKFNNEDYILINNHLKCCGDGIMDPDDPWDEETRRYDACVLLDEYIQENFDNQNVILLGDLNDLLTDDEPNNVFQVFLNDPFSYKFTDMAIAEGPSADWSYPSWPSHLDHIMITNELFDDFEDPESEIMTIRIDDYLENGFWEYESYVSDHRPVGLKLMPHEGISSIGERSDISKISISPNPCSGLATIQFEKLSAPAVMEIRNPSGQLIETKQLHSGEEKISFNTLDLNQGIYLVYIISKNSIAGFERLTVVK